MKTFFVAIVFGVAFVAAAIGNLAFFTMEGRLRDRGVRIPILKWPSDWAQISRMYRDGAEEAGWPSWPIPAAKVGYVGVALAAVVLMVDLWW